MAIARAKAEEIAKRLKEREAASGTTAPPASVPPAAAAAGGVGAASLQAAALQEQIRRQMEQACLCLDLWVN